MKKEILLALLFLALIANVALADQGLVDTILLEGLVVSPDIDVSGVIKQLGRPLNTTVSEVKNKYSENNDQIETLFYKDLRVVVYTFNHPEYGWSKVAQVVVSGNSYGVPIEIGLIKARVVELVGAKNTSSTEDSWYYYPSEEEPHLQLIIKFNDNTVSEVIWSHMP